jgi:hypothetical protein
MACSLYTSTPLYVFMAWCVNKHRDNFAFAIRCVFKVHNVSEAGSTSFVRCVWVKLSTQLSLLEGGIRCSVAKALSE